MTTFRACYYVAPDGQSDMLLTGPGEVTLPAHELIEAAVTEARRGNLIGSDDHMLTEEALREGLEVGDHKEAT